MYDSRLSDRINRIANGPTKTLYHATSFENAKSIFELGFFVQGNGGFRGPGIYFSSNRENAQRRARSSAAVVLKCKVSLGNVWLNAPQNCDISDNILLAFGFDSVCYRWDGDYMIPRDYCGQIEIESVNKRFKSDVNFELSRFGHGDREGRDFQRELGKLLHKISGIGREKQKKIAKVTKRFSHSEMRTMLDEIEDEYEYYRSDVENDAYSLIDHLDQHREMLVADQSLGLQQDIEWIDYEIQDYEQKLDNDLDGYQQHLEEGIANREEWNSYMTKSLSISERKKFEKVLAKFRSRVASKKERLDKKKKRFRRDKELDRQHLVKKWDKKTNLYLRMGKK